MEKKLKCGRYCYTGYLIAKSDEEFCSGDDIDLHFCRYFGFPTYKWAYLMIQNTSKNPNQNQSKITYDSMPCIHDLCSDS